MCDRYRSFFVSGGYAIKFLRKKPKMDDDLIVICCLYDVTTSCRLAVELRDMLGLARPVGCGY